MISGYTASSSQSFNNSSMSIIPWSYLSFWLNSLAGPRSLGCCCAIVISIIWCLSLWSFAVVIPVTYQLSIWSSIKFQVTYYSSTWSSFTWVFLIICHPSAWSSVTWSWFIVKNINRIFLSISSYLLRRSKNFVFFIFENCREDGLS